MPDRLDMSSGYGQGHHNPLSEKRFWYHRYNTVIGEKWQDVGMDSESGFTSFLSIPTSCQIWKRDIINQDKDITKGFANTLKNAFIFTS